MYVCHVFVFYEKVKESKSEVKALKKSLILERESEISVLEDESGCDIRKGKEKLPNQGRLQNVQRASQSLIASFRGNNKTIRHPSQGNK